MGRFKVGDRVVFVRTVCKNGPPDAAVGEAGVVTEIKHLPDDEEPLDVVVRLDCMKKYGDTYTTVFMDEELEYELP